MTRLLAWFHRARARRRCNRVVKALVDMHAEMLAKPMSDVAREEFFRQIIASQANE